MAFCDNCGHELRSTAKFCGACGTKAETTSQDTNQHSVAETPPPKHGYQRAPGNDMGITTSRPAGRIWYLLPLLFGILGGIIAYAVIRHRNPRRARNILILTIIMGFLYGLVAVGVIVVASSGDWDSDASMPFLEDSVPRAPAEMSESEKIDQILSEFPKHIQQIKRAQLEDCKYNIAYLQSDALGDMYKERCFNAILGR